MITALFGGSFDPVHKGHVNAVRSLLDTIPQIDRVIIMPAFLNPFKANTMPPADGKDRIEMCRLAFGSIPVCEVSDYEISKGGVSYTAVTLEHLREIYPDDRLILTVGSDSLESLPRWHRAGDIIKTAEIAAAARSDEDMGRINGYADNIRRLGGVVHIIKTRPFDISSTEIREKILNNQDISCYIEEDVVKYIMCNKIYRNGDSFGCSNVQC